MTIFFFLIFLLSCAANPSTQNPMDRTMQIARNQYLRVYISKKTKHAIAAHTPDRLKEYIIFAKERTNKIYNSMLSKYHDAQITYYSLSEENRELIEQLINLHF